MKTKHTPGPWFSDERGNVWRRDPADLYENGGGVAGEKAVATAHKGWFGDGYTGYPVIANARLIAAAPELLEALQRIADGQEMSGTYTFGDVVLRYQEIARAAIAKAVSS